jgi:hypothetical protein
MREMLRGMALSILFYCVFIGVVLVSVVVCGGNIYQVPTGVFIGVGACCGILASIINEKLD